MRHMARSWPLGQVASHRLIDARGPMAGLCPVKLAYEATPIKLYMLAALGARHHEQVKGMSAVEVHGEERLRGGTASEVQV
jgi:hypothetical protein